MKRTGPRPRRALSVWLVKPRRIEQQLVRFAAAGVVTTALDVTLLYLLTEYAHIHYLISVALAFLTASAVSYMLSVSGIFWSGRHRRAVEMLIFLLTSVVGLVLNELIVFSLVEFLFVWYMAAKLVAVGVAALWNFWCRRHLVFAA